MKRILVSAMLGLSIAAGSATVALASPSPNGPGQPNVDCADVSDSPAGFGTDGFANAESRYAGSDETPSLAHAHSAAAVSQYDVACLQVSAH